MIWVRPSCDFVTTETQKAQSRGRPLTADNRPSTAKYAKEHERIHRFPSPAHSTSLRPGSSAGIKTTSRQARQDRKEWGTEDSRHRTVSTSPLGALCVPA